jgi:hypothetical protein
LRTDVLILVIAYLPWNYRTARMLFLSAGETYGQPVGGAARRFRQSKERAEVCVLRILKDMRSESGLSCDDPAPPA